MDGYYRPGPPQTETTESGFIVILHDDYGQEVTPEEPSDDEEEEE